MGPVCVCCVSVFSRGTNQADNLVLYWRVIKYIPLLSHDNVLHLRAVKILLDYVDVREKC